jgi:hypothetical protein
MVADSDPPGFLLLPLPPRGRSPAAVVFSPPPSRALS